MNYLISKPNTIWKGEILVKNKTDRKTNYQLSIRRNMKYFLPIIAKKYPVYLLLNAILIIFNGFTPIINIYFPTQILSQLINGINANQMIIYILALVLGNQFSLLVTKYLEMKIVLINEKMSQYLDSSLNMKSIEMDYENCENPEIKDLVERAKRGMKQETQGLKESVRLVSDIISNIITFSTVFVIVMTSKMPILLVVSIINVIFNMVIASIGNKFDNEFYKKNTRINRFFSYYFYQIVSFKFAKDIRLFNAQSLVKNSSEEQINKMTKTYKELSIKQMILSFISVIYSTIVENFVVYVILIIAFAKGIIDLPQLNLLFTSFATFTYAIFNAVNAILNYKKATVYQSSYIDFMELPNKKHTGKMIPNNKIESIEFKNVSFKYPRTDRYILRNINLKITKDERLSLVGLNGAGKTTLIKLLCRLYDIEEGEILVNGINIKEYEYESYLKLFSVVFQDFRVISFSIKENIEILEDNHEKLYDCFERAGIKERIEELPNKENTFINKWFTDEGVEFSGGEMQKLAITRALYKSGPIVILDEPTASLDPLAEAEIYYHFNEVIGKKLTIFISHRLSSCRFSDRIVVIDGQNIVEIGTHEQLMKNKNGRYKEMFDAQSKYYQENKK